MSSSDYIVKPLATGAVALAIDHFFKYESDLNKSITFGASAAAGAYLGMMIGSSLPDLSNTLPTFLGNGKGLLQRAAEIGCGTGVAYGVNKYIMKNSSYKENIINKVGVIIAADLAAGVLANYMNSPLGGITLPIIILGGMHVASQVLIKR